MPPWSKASRCSPAWHRTRGHVPGLRIIGYKRSASIAFVIQRGEVVILCVVYGGRNITADLLDERL